MMNVKMCLTILLMLMLFQGINGTCPANAPKEEKFYELQIAVTSKATICPGGHKSKLSELLKTLLDEAFSREMYIKKSRSEVCSNPTPIQGRRALTTSETTDEKKNAVVVATQNDFRMESESQNDERQLLWGRYIYRGGSRCIFCNADNIDFRRSLSTSNCDQFDEHFPTKKFLPKDWDGSLIRRYFHLRKSVSLVSVIFDIVQEGRDQFESIGFRSSQVRFKLHHGQLRPRWNFYSHHNEHGASWAYRTKKFNQKTGFHRMRVVVHLPHGNFENGRIAVRFRGQRRKENGRATIENLVVVAREFCKNDGSRYEDEMEDRLSDYLTKGLRNRLPYNHCMRQRRSIFAYVNLSEKSKWADAKPQCD